MAKKSGFLVGALIGAAAALFLAPKKGSELREDAGKAFDDFKADPKGTVSNVTDSAKAFYDEKFSDIKEKFDNGDISAERAKDYLVAKKDDIKAKIDSGELSKESVMDFVNKTKDSISDKFNTAKDSTEELFDEDESSISDSVVEAQEAVTEKAEEVKDAATEKVEEIASEVSPASESKGLSDLQRRADEIAEKAKELTE
ncbi:YtxH domain-containing protein [Lactococcus termiticola]|uniref:Gas vesicle protein n=1 Tax=Lactococcus termiticola TaxID=2169526 RepID=A0A2R5HFY1_9LACT|nr:YtxH domain-containing protein [Lactococcus termiticola]GBG96969.1 hypothetical protein NtB2_01105 [Lactococcus termiticola]